MLPGAKSNQMSWMTREDPVQIPGVSPWTAHSPARAVRQTGRDMGKPIG